MSEVWDELSDISRANILEMVGGKRNANVVSSLLESFKIAEDALNKSANSAGSALQENERHLDSIQGRIEKFNASFQTLSTTVINTDLVKIVVEIGRFFVEKITEITEAFGGLGLVLSSVPLAMFVSKLKPVAETLGTIKDAAKSFAGGEKRLPY